MTAGMRLLKWKMKKPENENYATNSNEFIYHHITIQKGRWFLFEINIPTNWSWNEQTWNNLNEITPFLSFSSCLLTCAFLRAKSTLTEEKKINKKKTHNSDAIKCSGTRPVCVWVLWQTFYLPKLEKGRIKSKSAL